MISQGGRVSEIFKQIVDVKLNVEPEMGGTVTTKSLKRKIAEVS